MYITIFKFNKRYNSTKQPVIENGVNVSVNLKEGVSIYTPTFTLNSDAIDTNYNYLKWDNRFYYINDFTYLRNNLYEISCTIDYLATYKQDILDTSAFVIYSSSRYNNNITDNRLSENAVATYKTNSATIFSDADNAGTYIINYITDDATYGATGLLWTNQTGATLLSNKLTDTNFFNLENFEKQFNNVYQSLLSCKWVPFNWLGRGTGGSQFRLGSYPSFVGGIKVSPILSYETNVTIPWQYNDFRNTSKHTSFLLYLSGYGFLPLNADDLIGKTSLNIKCNIDGVTGERTYIIDRIAKCSANFGVSMSIGSVSSNVLGTFTSLANAGSDYLQGNNMGSGVNLFNAYVSSKSRQLGNTGTQSGISAITSSIGQWQNVYLISICHDTNIEPNTIIDTNGRPLNEVAIIGELVGYVQTTNASVKSFNNDISQILNDTLNGGVYIE